jgi:alpha-glucosidase
VQAETGEPASMLELYRAGLRLRRAEPSLREQALSWLPSGAGVLAFRRGDIVCVVNMSRDHAELPGHAALLLSSQPLRGTAAPRLPPDTAAWLRP